MKKITDNAHSFLEKTFNEFTSLMECDSNFKKLGYKKSIISFVDHWLTKEEYDLHENSLTKNDKYSSFNIGRIMLYSNLLGNPCLLNIEDELYFFENKDEYDNFLNQSFAENRAFIIVDLKLRFILCTTQDYTDVIYYTNKSVIDNIMSLIEKVKDIYLFEVT